MLLKRLVAVAVIAAATVGCGDSTPVNAGKEYTNTGYTEQTAPSNYTQTYRQSKQTVAPDERAEAVKKGLDPNLISPSK